jgi:hypothetical protein
MLPAFLAASLKNNLATVRDAEYPECAKETKISLLFRGFQRFEVNTNPSGERPELTMRLRLRIWS